MLISHRYNFLFVHIAKTGGTSIRAALSSASRREPWGWATWICHGLSRASGHRLGVKIPRHAPVIVAREMLDPTVFAGLYKFAFVRNPWDRLLSAYGHFQRERQDVLAQHRIDRLAAFVDFLITTPAEQSLRGALVRAIQRPQLESLVGLRGELLVDLVGRFETLSEDFAQVACQLAFPISALPHKRRGRTPADYRMHYPDALAERVATHYAADLAAFQYSFSSPATPLPCVGALPPGIAGRISAGRAEDRLGGLEC